MFYPRERKGIIQPRVIDDRSLYHYTGRRGQSLRETGNGAMGWALHLPRTLSVVCLDALCSICYVVRSAQRSKKSLPCSGTVGCACLSVFVQVSVNTRKVHELEKEMYLSVYKPMLERDLLSKCVLLPTLSLEHIHVHNDEDGKNETHAQQRKTLYINGLIKNGVG